MLCLIACLESEIQVVINIFKSAFEFVGTWATKMLGPLNKVSWKISFFWIFTFATKATGQRHNFHKCPLRMAVTRFSMSATMARSSRITETCLRIAL